MNVTASQIRQDLNNFGGFGQQGYGYNVKYLYDEIGNILGINQRHNMIVIGAGNLGQALANQIAPMPRSTRKPAICFACSLGMVSAAISTRFSFTNNSSSFIMRTSMSKKLMKNIVVNMDEIGERGQETGRLQEDRRLITEINDKTERNEELFHLSTVN